MWEVLGKMLEGLGMASTRGRWRWLTSLTILALVALFFVSNRNPQLGLLQNYLPKILLSPADSQLLCEPATACNANESLKLVDQQSPQSQNFSFPARSSFDRARGSKKKSDKGVYYNWVLFEKGYMDMLHNFKIYVYEDVHKNDGAYANVFMRLKNPFDPKLGNYFSEHMFKVNLLDSTFLTSNPREADLFYLPFSINVMRNDPRIRSEMSIPQFVASYVDRIRKEFEFWNKSEGADHFYVCCHSVGRDAPARSNHLRTNAMQVACSSNNYHKFYIPHKDVPLAQVWPRPPEPQVSPPQQRKRLAFYAGRAQNSRIRSDLINVWGNDPDMDIHSDKVRGYVEAFRRSKYCLHVKGYEVNTARISDALHYGCVPVIISDHYDLPFANVLDWSKFSVIISQGDIPQLKQILLSISDVAYSQLHENVLTVRKHFSWHKKPENYDSFLMTLYQLWLRKNIISPLVTP